MADTRYDEVPIIINEKKSLAEDRKHNEYHQQSNHQQQQKQSQSQLEQQQQQQQQQQHDVSSTSTANPIRQHIMNAYDATLEDIRVSNEAVRDHNPRPETPTWLVRCFHWLPLHWFLVGGGLLCIAFAILDMSLLGSSVRGIRNVIFFYIFCLGILMVIIESPVTLLTRGCQLGLFFWFRLLSRLWGRAWFYLFSALLCFAASPSFTATTLAGVYLILWVPIMFLVSHNAAEKYKRMFIYVAAGTEGHEREQKFIQKFDELDVTKTGSISSTAIILLATQAGRHLSNAERHAIHTFLDAGCNGRISKEDFIQQFRNYNLKLKFL